MGATCLSDKPRREGRFILAAVLTAALCVLLAFWFAVPFSGGAAGEPDTASLSEAVKVDLNTAGVEALCTLPNVGESRAQAIIDYRVSAGWFKTVEDAAAVPGITREIVDSWQELAYVSRRPY